jgi:hypothetical protein
MSAARSVTANYAVQHLVTFEVSPVGTGTTNATGYYDAGSISILANANAGYVFSSWSTSGSISISNPTANPTTAVVSGTGTITANFGGIFGNTNTGSSSYSRSIEDTIVGTIFTTPGYSVTAQSISAYIHVTGSTYDMKAAIYTTGGDLVGTAGTQEVSVTTSTDDRFVVFNYATGTQPTLAANTQYVLVVWAEGHSSSAYIYGSSSSGNSRYESRSYSGTFPSSVGSWSGTDTDLYSIYCTYSIP